MWLGFLLTLGLGAHQWLGAAGGQASKAQQGGPEVTSLLAFGLPLAALEVTCTGFKQDPAPPPPSK